MAAALGLDYPRLAAPVNGAAAAIAAIQLPRGKHHLSDIVVGAAIGGTAEWLVSKPFARVDAAIPANPDASAHARPATVSVPALPAPSDPGPVRSAPR